MSNETKHTPGPWTAEPTQSGNYNIRQRPAFRPALVWDTGLGDETYANARLIAAAPDLLAALRDVQIALAQWRDSEPVNVRGIDNLEEVKYLIVDAAIAKATD